MIEVEYQILSFLNSAGKQIGEASLYDEFKSVHDNYQFSDNEIRNAQNALRNKKFCDVVTFIDAQAIKISEYGVKAYNMERAKRADIAYRKSLEDKILKINSDSDELQKTSLFINKSIAIGTAIAAVYYISEWFKDFGKYLPTLLEGDLPFRCIFLLLGMIIGMLIHKVIPK